MPAIRLRHVERFTDRHGKVRYYFRRGHGPRVVLPGDPASEEFMTAYRRSLAAPVAKTVGGKAMAGTFSRLAQDYFQTPNFLAQKTSSQKVSRRIIERFIADHGHRLVKQMQRGDVLKMMADMAVTPSAANNFLKKLRVILSFAIETGVRKDDPTLKIKKFKEGRHHTWNDAEVAQFEGHFALGTFERTAFALHLYTGQRRDDVRRMAWSDIDGAVIRVVQEKSHVEGDNEGDYLYIPIHQELRKVLAAWKRRHVAILVGARGKPYTVESYGNLMADAIDDAGLPDRCVLHGVRKTAARRLAEAGCSANEIASITGHKSLDEVERYTKAADQRKLAHAAIHRLPRTGTTLEQDGNGENKPPKP